MPFYCIFLPQRFTKCFTMFAKPIHPLKNTLNHCHAGFSELPKDTLTHGQSQILNSQPLQFEDN